MTEASALNALTVVFGKLNPVIAVATPTLLAAVNVVSEGMSPKLGVMFRVLTNKFDDVMFKATN